MSITATSYLRPDSHKLDEIYSYLEKQYQGKHDPWGLNLATHRKCVELAWFFYQKYFRVKLHNNNHVKNENYMIIANHSGQIAIDALLIMIAFTLELSPPKVVRSMVERFVPKIPFFGELSSGAGHVLGDRKNCLYLLERGENILVFPEGVRGIAKPTSQFYQLQDFTSGFFKLAVQTKTNILPLAVVGAEEFYPYVMHFPRIAKLLKLPVLPLTPTFPFLGILGTLPLPSPVDIYVGKPFSVKDLDLNTMSDKDMEHHVAQFKTNIQSLVDEGLKKKRNYLGESKK